MGDMAEHMDHVAMFCTMMAPPKTRHAARSSPRRYLAKPKAMMAISPAQTRILSTADGSSAAMLLPSAPRVFEP